MALRDDVLSVMRDGSRSDRYHRKNNRGAYWMWVDTPFWNDGKITRPAKRKKAAR